MVVCGFLGDVELGYGQVTMRKDLAQAALTPVSEALSMSLQKTAEAVIRVAVSGMYLEVSKLVSRYGIDPREMSLIAFGGAGPMLGCNVARELNMRRVVVPLTPGVLSAFGGLIADIKNDFIQTAYFDLVSGNANAIRDGFAALRTAATTWLRNEQKFTGDATLLYSADMRYQGQSFEIDTPLSESDIENCDVDAMAGAFNREHERLYEHADNVAPIQVINLRLVAVGVPPKPTFKPLERGSGKPTPLHETEVYIDGARRSAAVYRREELAAGDRFSGPAVVAQDDCTTCILEEFVAVVDKHGNLILELED